MNFLQPDDMILSDLEPDPLEGFHSKKAMHATVIHRFWMDVLAKFDDEIYWNGALVAQGAL